MDKNINRLVIAWEAAQVSLDNVGRAAMNCGQFELARETETISNSFKNRVSALKKLIENSNNDDSKF